jgi:hypothetical protein
MRIMLASELIVLSRRHAGRMTADTPRWAVMAAYAVPLCVLPSSVWRVSAVVDGDVPVADGGWYLILLSCLATVLSLLTLGLVHSWGEVVPHWVPLVGGRPVPVHAAVVPAMIGSALLFGLCLYVLLNSAFGWVGQGPVLVGAEDGPLTPPTGWTAATYVPLAAWAPLLAAVTVAYRRRRVGGRMGAGPRGGARNDAELRVRYVGQAAAGRHDRRQLRPHGDRAR